MSKSENMSAEIIELIYNISKGHMDRVISSISRGVVKVDSDYVDYALLRVAIVRKQIEIAKRLINDRFRVNSEKRFSFNTPLHEAIKIQNIEIVEMLLENGASINALTKEGKSLIQIAIEQNNCQFTNWIRTKVAELSYFDDLRTNNHWTPLHVACAKGDVEKVEHLLDQNVEIDESIKHTSPFWQGYTALHIAVEFRDIPLIEILLLRGADQSVQDVNGKTPFHVVGKDGFKIYDMLLKSPSFPFDLNVSDNEGVTQFHLACAFCTGSDVTRHFLTSKAVDINGIVNANASKWASYTPLHIAVVHNAQGVIEVLLKHGANFKIRNAQGETAFQMACKRSSHFAIISFFTCDRLLADMLSDVNNSSYLQFACMSSDGYAVRYLLAGGVDPNIAVTGDNLEIPLLNSRMGFTSLHLSARNNCDFIVKMLLDDSRANVNARNLKGETPLHLAVSNPLYIKVVKTLLEKGADVLVRDEKGQTPFDVASKHMDEDVMGSLLYAYSDYSVNPTIHEGLTLFHLACTYDMPEALSTVRNFLNSGNVDVDDPVGDCQDKNCTRPLHLAVQGSSIELLQLLLDHGAKVDVRDENGKRPLDLCFSIDMDESMACKQMALLLDAGANINAQTFRDETVLHRALRKNAFAIVELLVNRGADLFCKNDDGMVPLHMIVRHWELFENVKETIARTLDCKTHEDSTSLEGRTPLHYAADYGCEPFVKLLLELGANINRQDSQGNTPLHVACKQEKGQVVRQLLKAGAAVDVKNREGRLPLHMLVMKPEILMHRTDFTVQLVGFSKEMFYMEMFDELLSSTENSDDMINRKDAYGRSALDMALQQHNEEGVDALLTCGISFENLLNTSDTKTLAMVRLRHLVQSSVLANSTSQNARKLIERIMGTSLEAKLAELFFLKDCREELTVMERVSITPYATLRDILFYSLSEAALKLPNKTLENYINYNNILKLYPYYGPRIWWLFKRAQRVLQVVNDAKDALAVIASGVVEREWPVACSENILKYLRESDFYGLTDAMTKEESG